MRERVFWFIVYVFSAFLSPLSRNGERINSQLTFSRAVFFFYEIRRVAERFMGYFCGFSTQYTEGVSDILISTSKNPEIKYKISLLEFAFLLSTNAL